MTKLIGTAPNQVPTNADLGSLAYVDHDNVNLTAADLKLKALSKTKDATAVDVFVYDTSQDTDGGAWRHRTQHTSWYNEGASSTRGSRKEFPSVAVIVAESNKVTIYDGDDPSLPMWMVFDRTTNAYDWDAAISAIGSYEVTCVSPLNGELLVGTTRSSGNATAVSHGLFQLRFIADEVVGRSSASVWKYAGPISQRADYVGFISTNGDPLVNGQVNDVAMTVLPDAPTDPATGLPVPTIAVATGGGVSVITDSGAVYDGTATYAYAQVDFYGKYLFYGNVVSGTFTEIVDASNITADGWTASKSYGHSHPPFLTGLSSWSTGGLIQPLSETSFVQKASTNNGISIVGVIDYGTPTISSAAEDIAAYITSSYNTGWMNGDIKLAALADTTAETLGDAASGATVSDPNGDGVYDGEHVTNGDFATDVSGWSIQNPTYGSISHSSGKIRLTQDLSGNGAVATQAITTVVGKHYTYSVDFAVDATTGNCFIYVGTSLGGTQTVNVNVGSVVGTYSGTFVATSTTHYISVGNSSATLVGEYSEWDNISVRLADPDRSVNGNGIGVHGSITKAAVATGADLVAYSGFSNANYLEQPYHSGIPDGTGQDIFITGWVHRPASNGAAVFADFGELASGKRRLFYVVGSTGSLAANNGAAQVNPVTVPSDTWVQCGLVWYANDDLKFYINGQEVGAGTLSRTAQTQNNPLYVGGGRLASYVSTKLALIRISATAPTADQIAKIYEDEKFLFQENAKATLYYDGTSSNPDAVTALAHDRVTDLLHVGTSSGRSVFQGLRRVDNTTTAVSTAISANDSLIVEQ